MLIIYFYYTTDNTQRSSTPKKAKPEEKDLSSKWFTCSTIQCKYFKFRGFVKINFNFEKNQFHRLEASFRKDVMS